MSEKKRLDCEDTPIEELDNLLRGNYRRSRDCDTERLLACVQEVKLDSVDEDQLKHVRLICKSNENFVHSAMKEFPCGFYLNADGTWFLAVLSNNAQLQDVFCICGANIETLWIYSSSMPSVDLHRLTGLKDLRLVDHPELVSIEHLGILTNLENLAIARCPKLLSLSELGNLTKLTSLTITYPVAFRGESLINAQSHKRVPILSQCSKLTSLPGLEKLTNLTRLNLFGCCSLTTLAGIENLEKLSELNLSLCFNLAELPRFGKLPNLTHLDISECRNISELPELEKLTQLTHLDLSMCDKICTLPGLEELTRLTHLDLSECRSLTALPGLERLTGLTSLSLGGCEKLSILPEGIRTMKSLRLLDLHRMCLKELPDWLPEITEAFCTDSRYHNRGNTGATVHLHGTTVEGVDMSIFEQPYEMVVEWFKNRNKVPLNEIKVVFLGDGTAGKSHTIARLMNNGGDPVGYVDVRTPGIVIKDVNYSIDNRDATLHLWDFGGQDILHSMHRIFLTQRTIYVVLVDGSIGNQDERARYWLQNIQSFAKDAPVILVLNKLDNELQAEVNAADLVSKYNGLKQIVKLSALQYSPERFKAAFIDVLLEEIEKTGYLNVKWPPEWVQVKHELEQMDTNYIHGGRYLEICNQCSVIENQKSLLRWFHDLGISFCYSDGENQALEDYVVLKPNWITNALYIILFNEREGGNGGLVPLRTIRNMLGWDAPNKEAIKRVLPDEYYVGYDVNYVLDVFHAFKLSFRKDDQYEFFPMLTDVNAKAVADEYAKDVKCLEFNMVFDYLPNNLLHRLMVERHQELDMDNIWLTGVKFHLPELGLSAVVVIDGNTLRFYIRHTDEMHRPNTYLAMLKANVDRIVKKMGLKAPDCQLVYKVHGNQTTFSYDRLLKMHARGYKEEYCENLDEDFLIEDILNQSAPAASENLNTLLDSMISVGLHLQGNKNYRGWDENGRNSVVRDSLGDNGYIVLDQSLRGTSETGKSYGELDLLIQREPNRPWVLCEALIVGGYTYKWNEHLDKLLNEYNPHGLSTLFLLTYVDCEKTKFTSIWTKYKQHIRENAPENFLCMPETVSMDLHSEYEYIKIARCSYRRDSYVPTVYHIFVQMDPKPKD